MPATLVQSRTGAQDTAATTTAVSWTTPATAGNRLFLVIASDSTLTGPSGWTIVPGAQQINFIEFDVYTKVAAGGETSTSYVNASSAESAWIFAEFSGVGAIISSSGQMAAATPTSYSTPTNTPTAGDRLLIAAFGATFDGSNVPGTPWTFTNGFTRVTDVANAVHANLIDAAALAWLEVPTADGATAYSTTGAWATPTSGATSAYSAIASFDVPAATGTAHARAIDDGTGVTDLGQPASRDVTDTITDQAGLTDTPTPALASAGATQTADAAGITDTITAALARVQTVDDLLALTDQATTSTADQGPAVSITATFGTPERAWTAGTPSGRPWTVSQPTL